MTLIEPGLKQSPADDRAIGKVNLNEIVYRLKEVRDPLMLRILEEILKSYDDLISERLSQTRRYAQYAGHP